jgi:hypothetical protein
MIPSLAARLLGAAIGASIVGSGLSPVGVVGGINKGEVTPHLKSYPSCHKIQTTNHQTLFSNHEYRYIYSSCLAAETLAVIAVDPARVRREAALAENVRTMYIHAVVAHMLNVRIEIRSSLHYHLYDAMRSNYTPPFRRHTLSIGSHVHSLCRTYDTFDEEAGREMQ